MGEESGSKSWWTTIPGIMTAVAGVISAVALLIGSLNQAGFFKTRETPKAPSPESSLKTEQSNNKNSAQPERRQETELSDVEQRKTAEALAVSYVNSLIKYEIENLTSQASFPFFSDNEIMLSKEDLRKYYSEKLGEASKRGQPNDGRIEITRIKARTIGEWKTEGYDVSKDRLLRSIQLDDGDFMIGIEYPHNGFAVYTRKVGGVLKIAGWWN